MSLKAIVIGITLLISSAAFGEEVFYYSCDAKKTISSFIKTSDQCNMGFCKIKTYCKTNKGDLYVTHLCPANNGECPTMIECLDNNKITHNSAEKLIQKNTDSENNSSSQGISK